MRRRFAAAWSSSGRGSRGRRPRRRTAPPAGSGPGGGHPGTGRSPRGCAWERGGRPPPRRTCSPPYRAGGSAGKTACASGRRIWMPSGRRRTGRPARGCPRPAGGTPPLGRRPPRYGRRRYYRSVSECSWVPFRCSRRCSRACSRMSRGLL